MRQRRPLKLRILAATGISIIISIISLIVSYFDLLPAAPDQFMQDWRTAKFSTEIEHQRDDIAIILIDDDTLSRFPFKTPINRRVLADIIRFVDSAEPKAIGLDIILDRGTIPGDDEQLLEALSQAKSKIVMIATDARESGVSEADLKWQSDLIERSGSQVSDPFLASEVGTLSIGSDVRRRFPEYDGKSNANPPFAFALAKISGVTDYQSGELIDWLLPSAAGVKPFQQFNVGPRDPFTTSVEGIMLDPIKRFLKGRIVLVGGAITGSDWHKIPPTLLTGEEVPGVYVHAQMLAQLIDGRKVRDFPTGLAMIVVFISAFSLYMAVEKIEEAHPDTLFELLILAAGIGFGILTFYLWRYNFPTSHLAIAWLGVSFLGVYASRILDNYRKSAEREG